MSRSWSLLGLLVVAAGVVALSSLAGEPTGRANLRPTPAEPEPEDGRGVRRRLRLRGYESPFSLN
jgi:hypothetical protein